VPGALLAPSRSMKDFEPLDPTALRGASGGLEPMMIHSASTKEQFLHWPNGLVVAFPAKPDDGPVRVFVPFTPSH
jgi:hypothetical protein